MSERESISKGLKLMFIGEIAILFVIIPFVGWLLALAGGIALLGLAADVCALLNVYFVCIATDAFMDGEGLGGLQESMGLRGAKLWKVYLVCTIILLVCSVLTIVPVVNILAVVAALITAIVQTVVAIFYIIYLYKWSKLLA